MTFTITRAIETLSDPNVQIEHALRQCLVVAKRIQSDPMVEWVKGELQGYGSPDVKPPNYRSTLFAPYRLTFHGPMGASLRQSLSRSDIPESLRVPAEADFLRQPVAEVSALTRDRENSPELSLPLIWVDEFCRLGNEGKAPRVEMMELASACRVLPRTHLEGIVDRVRTSALELLLELEAIDPSVGDVGKDAEGTRGEARSVSLQIITQNIYGDRASVVSQGQVDGAASVAIDARVTPGDREGLLDAAAKLLEPDQVADLRQALDEDGNTVGESTRSFLTKLRDGAAEASGQAAVSGLTALLTQFLGGTFPW